jgi:hypothetical protein
MSLANLNRTVHLKTYNNLIGEEARALYAEQVGGKATEIKEEAEEALNKRAREGVKIEAKMEDANKKRRK